MAEYLIYHMKKTVVRFIVMALLLVMLVNSTVVMVYSYMAGDRINVSTAMFTVFGIVAPAIVTALEFSQFMNRRNLDTWFSLPISRKDLFTVHFINGAIQLTVSVLLGAILAVFKISRHPELDLKKSVLYFFLMIGVMLLIYMLYTFLFVSANNVFDGCVFMTGSIFIPLSVFTIFRNFYIAFKAKQSIFGGYDMLSKIPFDGAGIFSVITQLGARYEMLIEPERKSEMIGSVYYDMSPKIPEISIPQASLWTAVCIAALAGAVYVFTTKKTESVSGISESWFGYRILIPLCAGAMLNSTAMTASAIREESILSIGLSIVGLIPAFIGVFVAYIIFRRGVKFKISDLISSGAIIAFYVISLLIFRAVLG